MKRLFALCLLASPAFAVTGCPMYEDGGCRSDYDCGPGYACHFSSGACVRPRSGGSGAVTAGEGGSSSVTAGQGGAVTSGEGGKPTVDAGDGGASAGNAGEAGSSAGAAGDVQGGAPNESAAGAAG